MSLRKVLFHLKKILFIISLFSKIPKFVMEFFIVFIILILSIFLLKIGYQLENVVPLLSLLAVASIRMIPSFNSLTANFLQKLKVMKFL